MIKAKKIDTKIGARVKLEFRKNELIERVLATMKGAFYDRVTKSWTLPYSARPDIEKKLGNFLLIWEDEDTPFNGGIDMSTIPIQPVVPGYSVEYNKAGEVVGATGFKVPPYGAFQVQGFNIMVERDFAIIGDHMGLGKTFQSITAIEARKKLGQLQRCLVLTKATLLYNWRDEVEKFTDCKAVVLTGPPKQRHKMLIELEKDTSWTFLIMSYETYRIANISVTSIDDALPIDALLLDEAHKIRNPMSRIGQCVNHIYFKYVYLLTATPILNTPLESFNYLKLGKKLPVSGSSIVQEWWNFKDRYAVYGGSNGMELVGYDNIGELRQVIQDNMIRRLKKDVLKDLPDVMFKDVRIELTAAQKKIYDAVRKEILADLAETDLEKVPSMLAKITRLQQVTSALDNVGIATTASNNAKLSALMDIVEDAVEAGEKVIIFSKFRPTIELLTEKFKKLNPAVITGGTDSHALPADLAVAKAKKKYKDWNMWAEEDRQKVIKDLTTSDRQLEVYKFQGDDTCKVFIGSIFACAEGLTLTAATHVINFDYPFNWAIYEQSFSRCHRLGQKNAVTVHNIMCSGTVDEKIFQIIMLKKGISESLLDSKVDSIEQQKAFDFVKSVI